MSAAPPPAFDASTIVIARPVHDADRTDADAADRADVPFEVFLLQRNTRSRFMPSAFVYPGGRLDPVDASPEVLALCAGRTPQGCADALQEPDVDPAYAVALFTAALREAFEEAGVLLVQPAQPHQPTPSLTPDALAAARLAVHADHAAWITLLSDLDARLDLASTFPLAHWITPESEPRRFDTRFFLAVCPPWQRDLLSHDTHETIASCWLTPQAALDRHAHGDLMLPPPTLCTLQQLASYPTLATLLSALRALHIPPILPIHCFEGDALHIILPNDPAHPAHPPKQPSPDPKRVVLRGDHWESIP